MKPDPCVFNWNPPKKKKKKTCQTVFWNNTFKYFLSMKRLNSALPVWKVSAKKNSRVTFPALQGAWRVWLQYLLRPVSVAHKYHKSDAQGIKFNSQFMRLGQIYPRINGIQHNHKQLRWQGLSLLGIVIDSGSGFFEVLGRVVGFFCLFYFVFKANYRFFKCINLWYLKVW